MIEFLRHCDYVLFAISYLRQAGRLVVRSSLCRNDVVVISTLGEIAHVAKGKLRFTVMEFSVNDCDI